MRICIKKKKKKRAETYSGWSTELMTAARDAGWKAAVADPLVNLIERRRNHKFFMLLCSIDNKTRRLTFIFPPFSRSVDAPQVTASDRQSHVEHEMSERTRLIETKEIGDQYIERADQSLNFEQGVALTPRFHFYDFRKYQRGSSKTRWEISQY